MKNNEQYKKNDRDTSEEYISPLKYTWDSVSIGGGGFVSQIYINSSDPQIIYFATNVGGLFLWDVKEKKLYHSQTNFHFLKNVFILLMDSLCIQLMQI